MVQIYLNVIKGEEQELAKYCTTCTRAELQTAMIFHMKLTMMICIKLDVFCPYV